MRLINADELLKKIDVSRFKNNHKTSEGRMVHIGEHNHFMKMIVDAPTVDAQLVVHAKWIKLKKPLYCEQRFKCSSCKGIVNDTHDFCHNCGARMDGEDNAADF